MSGMTLSRSQPPFNFRPWWNAENLYLVKKKSEFDFQNDIESQHASVSFQILTAYKNHMPSEPTSEFDVQNGLEF